jgi:hypothetical protein
VKPTTQAERDDNARAYFLAGFAVCARLLVRGRADLVVRLAGDIGFATKVSALVLAAFRTQPSSLGSLVEAIEETAQHLDGGTN